MKLKLKCVSKTKTGDKTFNATFEPTHAGGAENSPSGGHIELTGISVEDAVLFEVNRLFDVEVKPETDDETNELTEVEAEAPDPKNKPETNNRTSAKAKKAPPVDLLPPPTQNPSVVPPPKTAPDGKTDDEVDVPDSFREELKQDPSIDAVVKKSSNRI